MMNKFLSKLKKKKENENTTTQYLWDTVKAVLRVHSNTGTPQETRKKSNK